MEDSSDRLLEVLARRLARPGTRRARDPAARGNRDRGALRRASSSPPWRSTTRSRRGRGSPSTRLRERALISLPPGPACGLRSTPACATAGFKPRIAFEASDPVMLVELAARGLGVAILPASLAGGSRLGGAFADRSPPRSCAPGSSWPGESGGRAARRLGRCSRAPAPRCERGALAWWSTCTSPSPEPTGRSRCD